MSFMANPSFLGKISAWITSEMIVYELFLSCLLRYKYYHFENKSTVVDILPSFSTDKGSNKKPIGQSLKVISNWRTFYCWWPINKAIWYIKSIWWLFDEIKSYFLRPSNYEKPINAQHHQQESEEVNPAPALKLNICKALSLNGNEVNPDNLQVYYC